MTTSLVLQSATLALNASRRFRYTADLARVAERRQLQKMGRFKTAAHVAMVRYAVRLRAGAGCLVMIAVLSCMQRKMHVLSRTS